MSRTQRIRSALQTHFDAWNKRDRERWIALFAVDVVLEDPVGGPQKQGRKAVEQTWDHAFSDGQEWNIEPVVQWICGNQAALHVRNAGIVGGKKVVVDSIEILDYSDDGKVVHLRSYFAPPEGVDYPDFFTNREISA